MEIVKLKMDAAKETEDNSKFRHVPYNQNANPLMAQQIESLQHELHSLRRSMWDEPKRSHYEDKSAPIFQMVLLYLSW